jgi:hypothetical protein
MSKLVKHADLIMNPLQEYSYLFANGIFQVKWADGTSIWIDRDILIEFEDWENKYSPNLEPKLIARSIEDMTGKEVAEILGWEELREVTINGLKRSWQQKADVDDLPFRRARQLLAVGVYPFNQCHFEDRTVLRASEA